MESTHLEKSPQYTVRNYLKGDEVALAKIFSECFGPVTPNRLLRWLRTSQVPSKYIFVGTIDGKLVSHVNMESKQLYHGEGVYIKTAGIAGVCTDSDYRKKGIVSNLLKLVLDHAQQEGYSNTSLFTGLDLSAHRIYRRLGFVDILTWRTYLKYLDYPTVFGQWLRYQNRSLKDSKMAAKKLEGWKKSVAVELREVGTLSFRFSKNRFQRLKKPPKKADIEFSTDLETYVKILRAVVQWEDAVKTGKLTLKRGESADIEMLKRILNWKWDD